MILLRALRGLRFGGQVLLGAMRALRLGGRVRPALLPLLALALSGCPGRLRSGDPATRDQEIARDILWAFHQDPRLEDVHVRCVDGAVTLKGRVASPEDRAEAERVAWNVRSVREVSNLVEVRPK